MALAFVCCDIVLLLKLLATEVAGKLIKRVRVMLLHVPVQGGLLAAREAADLAPVQRAGLRINMGDTPKESIIVRALIKEE